MSTSGERAITSLSVDPAATPVNVSSGDKANAQAQAIMPAVAGKKNYVTGMEITAAGSTAALAVLATLTDGTWTLSYVFTFPAGATVAAAPITLQFDSPLESTAANTAITLTLPAGGAGNAHACVNLYGFAR